MTDTTTEVDPQVRQCIIQGALRLDAHFGNGQWRERIDLSTLVMYDLHECLLAQLFGDYQLGTERLGLDYQDTLDLGFDAPLLGDGMPKLENYEPLQRAWTSYLEVCRG